MPTTDVSLRDDFFHTRDNPWYSCGTVLDSPPTAAEALVAAGLDWQVEKRPLLTFAGDGLIETIQNKYAIVRTDTDDFFGVVGGDYVPFQNEEAFAFADGLIDGGMLFDSAGSYGGQRRIFLTAKLPDTVQILGADPYQLYLFLVTAHDGTKSITAYVVPIRLRCTNMLRLTLRNAVTKWTIRHTTSTAGKLVEAREALAITFKAGDAFDLAMQKLVERQVSDDELRHMLSTVLPESPRRGVKIESVVQIMHESPSIDGYRGTRYGALQAFTEWLDWGREVRSDEARFSVSFEGYGARQRQRMYRRLEAVSS